MIYCKVAIELISKLLSRSMDEKILLLSYSLDVISEIQIQLLNGGIKSFVFKGDTTTSQRNEIIEKFNDRSNLERRVLLLSFKSGGAGTLFYVHYIIYLL